MVAAARQRQGTTVVGWQCGGVISSGGGGDDKGGSHHGVVVKKYSLRVLSFLMFGREAVCLNFYLNSLIYSYVFIVNHT